MSDQSKHTPLDSQKLQSNNGVTLQVQKNDLKTWKICFSASRGKRNIWLLNILVEKKIKISENCNCPNDMFNYWKITTELQIMSLECDK